MTAIFGEDKFPALAHLAVVVLLSDCAFKVLCTRVMYRWSYRGKALISAQILYCKELGMVMYQ